MTYYNDIKKLIVDCQNTLKTLDGEVDADMIALATAKKLLHDATEIKDLMLMDYVMRYSK